MAGRCAPCQDLPGCRSAAGRVTIDTGTGFDSSAGGLRGAGHDAQAVHGGAAGGGLKTPTTRRTTSPTAPSAIAVTMRSCRSRGMSASSFQLQLKTHNSSLHRTRHNYTAHATAILPPAWTDRR